MCSGNEPSKTCFNGDGKYVTAPASAIKSELEITVNKIKRFNNYHLGIREYEYILFSCYNLQYDYAFKKSDSKKKLILRFTHKL